MSDKMSNIPPEYVKSLQQLQKKKEYNQWYYRTKVKPQKEKQKSELTNLRQKCQILEKKSTIRIEDEVIRLTQELENLEAENTYLRNSLDAARQRNYELLKRNPQDYLPALS